jgi:Anthranilate/para-aminobenzoate synthases component I
MKRMNSEEMIEKMDEAGQERAPFLFVIDFSGENCHFLPLDNLSGEFYYSIPGLENLPSDKYLEQPFHFIKQPISFERYKKGFDIVKTGILRGYSFLVNLTFPTRVDTNLSLAEIFGRSNAPYRLYMPGRFVCFSPECFVKIKNGRIFSYPMKGTIDATLPDAENRILNDAKEKAEHYTIVDLIRNDLSRVANQVEVAKFRYIDRVETNGKTLLQVSSEISGCLPADYRSRLGEIIFSMLPAGSISGAPKDATLNLIRQAELDERGYYTGIFGVFDGENLDSAVMIRFIEQTHDGLFFRSGGGITAQSDAESEYHELIDKVYVPFT